MATTTLRRCTGSERFGIEPHEAPIDVFPKQPSRKDGLGVMCAVHWKAYVKGLAAERKARTGQSVTAHNAAMDGMGAKPAKAATFTKNQIAKNARAKRTRPAKPVDPKLVEAEALIASVDALPGPEHIKRVGDDDVQAALETVGQMRAPSADGADAMEA